MNTGHKAMLLASAHWGCIEGTNFKSYLKCLGLSPAQCRRVYQLLGPPRGQDFVRLKGGEFIIETNTEMLMAIRRSVNQAVQTQRRKR